MKGVGLILVAIGVLGLLAALNMNTTVHVPGQTIGSGESMTNIPSQSVHNLGLMLRQLEWVVVSGFVALSGVLFYGFGEIVEQRDVGVVGKATRPRTSNVLGKSIGRVPLDTTSETSEALGKTGCEKGDLDRLLDGEPLPPKFDERGRPLQQPGDFAAVLKSE
jgi:hypothetical protein